MINRQTPQHEHILPPHGVTPPERFLPAIGVPEGRREYHRASRGGTQEVMIAERRIVDRAAVKRAVPRSTRASAQLERRVVPNDFVRSQRAERFLAQRRKRA